LGYDILVPREVRLDAFLFGEEAGRYLVALPETGDDAFLLKMDEARLNCCFLGRTTKNRVMVDGFDFGLVSQYCG
jgi:phosphoribosylformylglycinamidine synthase